MTVVELEGRRRQRVAAEELQEAARQAYLTALDRGEELTQVQLGEMFGRSRSWGRDRIREADRQLAAMAASEVDDADPLVVEEEPGRPWYAWALTAVVGVVAMAASYRHMYHLTLAAGEPTWVAMVLPVTVDLLMVAALWAGERGRWWFRLALTVSLAANISMATDVTAAQPQLVAIAVAAWAPVALFGVHRLLFADG